MGSLIRSVDVSGLQLPRWEGSWDPVEAVSEMAADPTGVITALPAPVLRALLAVRDALVGTPPVLKVSGVPVGRLGPTPASPSDGPWCRDLTSSRWVVGVATVLGTPFGFTAEAGGRLVQDLVPTLEDRYAQRSSGSEVRLMWHTETAFSSMRPRWVVLLCLRAGPSPVPTLLAGVDQVVARLDPETVAVLREPRFVFTGADPSFGLPDDLPPSPPAPVVFGPPGREQMCWDEQLSSPVDHRAARALDELSRAVADASVEVVLSEGDLLVFDNARVSHGRAPFVPRFDGTDRWLLRCLVADSTLRWDPARMCGPRVLEVCEPG